MTSIWVSWIAGFILLVGVSVAIPQFVHGFSVNIAGTHYTYAAFAGGVPVGATSSSTRAGRSSARSSSWSSSERSSSAASRPITANSRMIYAFSRDGAVPFSNFWHHVSKRSHVPVHSAWFGAVGAFILSDPVALPGSAGYTAYAAVTSIAVIGLYVAYLIPVFLRRINGDAFTPGPWKLGKWGPFFGWVAIVWVVFICVLFCLPTLSPITTTTFNYTPMAVVVVIGLRRHLVRRVGAQVVQGSQDPGHPRRAGGDRARAVDLDRHGLSSRAGGRPPALAASAAS